MKHDLVQTPPSHDQTIRERTNSKKRRTISLRRPRSYSALSPSPSPSPSSSHSAVHDSNIAADPSTSCNSEKSIPRPEAECDSTEDIASDQPLFISNSSIQAEHCVQESRSAGTEECVISPFSEPSKLCHSTFSLNSEASEDSERQQESLEAGFSPNGLDTSSATLVEISKEVDSPSCSITSGTIDTVPALGNDPDCGEDQGDYGMDDSEFPDIDEIEDWDDFELDAACPNIECVAENACPTPDAHVNRCLDGHSTEHVPSESAATNPSFSGNPLSSVIGAIRSVISHIPSGRVMDKDKDDKKAAVDKKKEPSKPRSSRPCPFYKRMPDTTFTVDAFCYGAVDGCEAYFLSHFHSDHYGGLTSSWNHGLIYCSSITANLVLSRLGVDEKYVRRLPMYEPTVINGVTVRLMDANHCPGSVLFVFDLQTPKRRYLHTGDFRASPSMSIDPILRQPQNVPIDILYLDTTYSNPRYTFPPQDLVVQGTANLVCRELGLHNNVAQTASPAAVVKITKKINIMESWLKKESGNTEKLISMSIKTSKTIKAKQKWQEPTEKDRIVICVGTYLIGKERVFKAIAKAIKSKVFVQDSKLQILACLEDPELMDMLTSNRYEAQVHLLHMGSNMSPESLQDYLDSLAPTFTRLIAIRPTGWTFTGSKKYTPADNGSRDGPLPIASPTAIELDLSPSFTSPTVKIYPVPYSEHSSFNELAGFVRSLDIRKIIPTVGVGSEKGRHAMNEWFRRWQDERRQGIGWQ
ncbi:DNA break repair nuclease [Mortierella sp. GBA30]|nr:DNA break repair nuclease [Mortierella sp. GBA30]